MLIINVYEGFTSEIRAYFLAYRLSAVLDDVFVLDLSQFYQGSFWEYHLDFLSIPSVEKYMCRDVSIDDKANRIKNHYKKDLRIIRNGDELQNAFDSYCKELIYYIVEDSYCYDSFFENHNEFFYRYIGDDPITARLYSFLELKQKSSEFVRLFDEIGKNDNSVGVHIRLGDFYNVGWIVDSDLAFYTASIQMIRETFDHPSFYIFSDDPMKAKELVGIGEDITFVHFEYSHQSDVEELFCLARCKHRILNKKSTYGLLAEAISQNRFKSDGLTVIIKKMNFADDAGNKEYVDMLVNSDKGVNNDRLLGQYKTLSVEEIEDYNKRYGYRKVVGEVTANDMSFDEKKNNTLQVVFLTRQNYSKSRPIGMQYFAHYLSMNEGGIAVEFVGKKGESQTTSDDLEELICNPFFEDGMSKLSSRIRLYPYRLLNEKNLYTKFVNRLRIKYNCNKTIVICRKPNAMPPKERHGDVLYIFIDFTDSFEKEAFACLQEYSKEEIEYLYDSSDVIVTFSKDIMMKYYNRNVVYIDLESIYPQQLILGGNNQTEMVDKYINDLCSRLGDIIISAI